MKTVLIAALLSVLVCTSSYGQSGLREGDKVSTPDGRTGLVNDFMPPDMAKVKFDDGTTKFYIRSDLKRVEAIKAPFNPSPQSLRVGDAVVYEKTEQNYRIVSINGDSAVINQGTGKYAMNNAITVKLADIITRETWDRRQNDEKEAKLVRAAFLDEAKAYLTLVTPMAWAYKASYKMDGGTIPQEPSEIAEMRQKFDALARICQKYPNLTNPPGLDERIYGANIYMHPADWCGMANERDRVVKNILGYASSTIAKNEISIVETAITEALRDPNGYVKDELQRLLFDRPAFLQKEIKAAVDSYAKAGEKIPDAVLAPLFARSDELKSRIQNDVSTRTWKQPAYKDPALEAIVKASYQKTYPGVKILSSGMTYATWEAYDDTSLVRADTDVHVYKYEKDKFRQKDGLILVQLPGQPYCQMRQFTVEQMRTGAAFGPARSTGTGKGGVFVKCP